MSIWQMIWTRGLIQVSVELIRGTKHEEPLHETYLLTHCLQLVLKSFQLTGRSWLFTSSWVPWNPTGSHVIWLSVAYSPSLHALWDWLLEHRINKLKFRTEIQARGLTCTCSGCKAWLTGLAEEGREIRWPERIEEFDDKWRGEVMFDAFNTEASKGKTKMTNHEFLKK